MFLIRLWQPERQINLHTENLFRKIEQKNWTAVSDFIGADYSDEWADDRAILLTRTREVSCYLRNVRIAVVDPNLTVEQDHGIWRGKVTINGDGGEAMALAKERVNSLPAPFELEWRQIICKPWDWKLVRARNPGLEVAPGVK